MNDIKQIIRAFRDGINPVTGEIFYKTVLSKYPMTSNYVREKKHIKCFAETMLSKFKNSYRKKKL